LLEQQSNRSQYHTESLVSDSVTQDVNFKMIKLGSPKNEDSNLSSMMMKDESASNISVED